jgi:hypothetical protein
MYTSHSSPATTRRLIKAVDGTSEQKERLVKLAQAAMADMQPLRSAPSWPSACSNAASMAVATGAGLAWAWVVRGMVVLASNQGYPDTR